jgi:hypothetical protein
MKKLVLAIFATLAMATGAFATDSSAPATLTYLIPITLTEQNALSIPIVRKQGVPSSTVVTNVASNAATWDTIVLQRPFATQDPGCFTITGEPNQNVSISLAMPNSLASLGAEVMSFPTKGIEGAVGNSCANAKGGAFAANVVDGTGTYTIPAGGVGYIAYRLTSGSSSISITNLTTQTYSGVAGATVVYQ